ncbi:unnamed protein product [Bursaphelenchus xylophilus]|uniref:(pine wood nematode) hypothetical protein n=1 Tax=Bursaphelenchus xylophilus TaxID=6326 RepID=A0A811KWA1_BURXY|nr:unnamed protein product [Bursaphelenchus xylophilus]CAG9106481.1 unnamed protein product [Bursaphelenchus xylophilus]
MRSPRESTSSYDARAEDLRYPTLDASSDSRLIAPTGLVLPAPVQTAFDVKKSEDRLQHYGATIIEVLGEDVYRSLFNYLQEAKTLNPVDFEELCRQINGKCRPLALLAPVLRDPNNVLLNDFRNLVTLQAQAVQFFLNGEFPDGQLSFGFNGDAVIGEDGHGTDNEVNNNNEADSGDNNDDGTDIDEARNLPVDLPNFEQDLPSQGDCRPPAVSTREVRLEDLPSTSRASRPESSAGTQSSYGRRYRPNRIFDPSDNQ